MASWRRIARPATAAAVAIFLMLCGAAPALSKPVITDPYNCLERYPQLKCCPSDAAVEIVDFEPQLQQSQLRVRKPAHTLSLEDVRKYEKAVALMRALPDDHPWNFVKQANVHCAYCSGGRLELGLNTTIEIHGSWHFFTWHRAYLYFYEKILGKLINDPTFALPFWNWDDPAGMSVPLIYRDNSSSLFNPTRYPDALNFTDISDCAGGDTNGSLAKQQQCNLQAMRRQFAAASNSTSIFYGGPLRAGSNGFPGSGPIENSPHNPVHTTTGSDMSQLNRAARDPLFFIHHSNVDRLWAIWAGIPAGNGSKIIDDRDFLDASFLFWDEKRQMVRIKVRDVIDTRKLGYVYEDVPLQWMHLQTAVEDGVPVRIEAVGPGQAIFPVILSDEVSVSVTRMLAAKKETLVVSGIELDGRDHVWFRVYVSRVGTGRRAEAGCFIHMARSSTERIPIQTKIQMDITDLIGVIGAAGDDRIVVTLNPKNGGEKVTIGEVSIE